MRLFSLILALAGIFSSCGYRGDESEFDNIFSGQWRAEEIRCYLDTTTTATEIYEMDSPVELVQYSFDGRTFSYSAQINSSPGCQVSATGIRAVQYYDNSSGEISFNAVSDHTSCTTQLDELNGTAVNVDVPFGINEGVAQNLGWVLDDVLEVRLPLSFAGSSLGPCSDSCLCYTYLQKN